MNKWQFMCCSFCTMEWHATVAIFLYCEMEYAVCVCVDFMKDQILLIYNICGRTFAEKIQLIFFCLFQEKQ